MEMGGEGGKRGIGGWRWEDGEGRQALGISSPSLEPPRRPPKEPNPVVKPLRSCFEEAPRCISRSDTRHQFRRLAAKVPLRIHLSPPPRLRRPKNLLFRPNPRRRVYPPTNGSASGKH